MKVQRTVTIDREVDEELRRVPALNFSALVNHLLKLHIKENEK